MVDKGLRRRIAPSVPLTLELEDEGGEKFVRSFRVSFDVNAMALVQEETGYSMLNGEIWGHIDETTLSSMFRAALLTHQPEYGGLEGLQVIRSYMDASNAEKITVALNEAFLIQLPKERRDKLREAQKDAKAKGENPTPPATDTAPEKTAAAD